MAQNESTSSRPKIKGLADTRSLAYNHRIRQGQSRTRIAPRHIRIQRVTQTEKYKKDV